MNKIIDVIRKITHYSACACLALVLIAICATACSTKSSNSKKYETASSNNYGSQSNSSSYNSSSNYDDGSTKWKEYAMTTYKASHSVSGGIMQHYAFSYNRSGEGKYIIYGTYRGTNVVTDQMELEIYTVESTANCLYLYCSELSTPVKIKIIGNSLYTNDGDVKYEEW